MKKYHMSFKKILVAVLLSVMFSVLDAGANQGNYRVALVVGNSNYKNTVVLPNPSRDAKAFGEKLKRIGFDEVLIKMDQTKDDWLQTMKDFRAILSKADAAVFYYAGHGMQMNGTNFLIPVDAKLSDERDVMDETIPLSRIIAELEDIKGVKVVFLDACRDNPLSSSLQKSGRTRSVLGRGLGKEEGFGGTLISYATKDGKTAEDGNGEHSPYTMALLKHIDTPDLDVELMLRRVVDEVKRITGNQQEPWKYGSLGADEFYFVRSNADTQTVDDKKTDDKDLELQDWQIVQKIDNIRSYEEFLKKYPKGAHVFFAKERLEQLRSIPTIGPFGIEFIRIPKGSFMMGDDPMEADEKAVMMNVDELEMGRYEVTQGQWKNVMGNNPSYFKYGDNYPVESVSWYDVKSFIDKLNERKDGCLYRLPSEAEWEFACRSAGKDQTYCGGNYIDNVAWYINNSNNKIHPVGTRQANDLGMHDMSGNVWEWVADLYREDVGEGGQQNQTLSDVVSYRVYRGGGWDFYNTSARSSNRGKFYPGNRLYSLGFRLVRNCL